MTPEVLEIDYTRFRGDTYPHMISVKSKATGQPINIAGCTFVMTVDPNPDPSDNTTKVLEMIGEIKDAPTGLVAIAPADATAADVPPDVYFHNIQMTDGLGYIRTIAFGKYTIKQDIPK